MSFSWRRISSWCTKCPVFDSSRYNNIRVWDWPFVRAILGTIRFMRLRFVMLLIFKKAEKLPLLWGRLQHCTACHKSSVVFPWASVAFYKATPVHQTPTQDWCANVLIASNWSAFFALSSYISHQLNESSLSIFWRFFKSFSILCELQDYIWAFLKHYRQKH